jgi:hypothetical protein
MLVRRTDRCDTSRFVVDMSKAATFIGTNKNKQGTELITDEMVEIERWGEVSEGETGERSRNDVHTGVAFGDGVSALDSGSIDTTTTLVDDFPPALLVGLSPSHCYENGDTAIEIDRPSHLDAENPCCHPLSTGLNLDASRAIDSIHDHFEEPVANSDPSVSTIVIDDWANGATNTHSPTQRTNGSVCILKSDGCGDHVTSGQGSGVAVGFQKAVVDAYLQANIADENGGELAGSANAHGREDGDDFGGFDSIAEAPRDTSGTTNVETSNGGDFSGMDGGLTEMNAPAESELPVEGVFFGDFGRAQPFTGDNAAERVDPIGNGYTTTNYDDFGGFDGVLSASQRATVGQSKSLELDQDFTDFNNVLEMVDTLVDTVNIASSDEEFGSFRVFDSTSPRGSDTLQGRVLLDTDFSKTPQTPEDFVDKNPVGFRTDADMCADDDDLGNLSTPHYNEAVQVDSPKDDEGFGAFDGAPQTEGTVDDAPNELINADAVTFICEDEFGDFGAFDDTTSVPVAPHSNAGDLDNTLQLSGDSRYTGIGVVNEDTPVTSEEDNFGDFDRAQPATAPSDDSNAHDDFGDFDGVDECIDAESSEIAVASVPLSQEHSGSFPCRARSKFPLLFARYAPDSDTDELDDGRAFPEKAPVERMLVCLISFAYRLHCVRIHLT